uniref:Uncharacterized protein n=1 Tax=Anguilla anguilla TaxID=7936 RepID=A0A0E9WGN5_ANGAN
MTSTKVKTEGLCSWQCRDHRHRKTCPDMFCRIGRTLKALIWHGRHGWE